MEVKNTPCLELELFSVIPPLASVWEQALLEAAYHSTVVYLPVTFHLPVTLTEIWHSQQISELILPYSSPSLPFISALQRELRCIENKLDWKVKDRHASFFISIREERGWDNSSWNEWSNSHLSELLFQVTYMSEAMFIPILYSHSVQYIWLWRIHNFIPFWKVFCL